MRNTGSLRPGCLGTQVCSLSQWHCHSKPAALTPLSATLGGIGPQDSPSSWACFPPPRRSECLLHKRYSKYLLFFFSTHFRLFESNNLTGSPHSFRNKTMEKPSLYGPERKCLPQQGHRPPTRRARASRGHSSRDVRKACSQGGSQSCLTPLQPPQPPRSKSNTLQRF